MSTPEYRRRSAPSWLDQFILWTEDIESPKAYKIWVGLSVLAGALGRRTYVMGLGKKPTYPNLYVVLVGPPGRCRKGEIMDAGVSLLRDWRDRIRIYAGKLTTPGLYTALLHHTNDPMRVLGGTVFIYASEFTALTGTDATPSRFFDDLCFLWDPEDEVHLVIKGQLGPGGHVATVKNLCVNLLGGTTPDSLTGIKASEIIGGGFASRTIFVVRYESEKFIGRTMATEEDRARDAAMRSRLVSDLGHIVSAEHLKGEVKGTREAWDYYVAWRKQMELAPPTDERLLHYLARKPKHVWKVAMLLSLSESDSMIIEEHHIRRAIELLDMVEPNMTDVYIGLADSLHERMIRLVRKEIAKAGGRMQLERLVRVMGHQIERSALLRFLTHMRSCGMLDIHTVHTSMGPQAVVILNEQAGGNGKDAAYIGPTAAPQEKETSDSPLVCQDELGLHPGLRH